MGEASESNSNVHNEDFSFEDVYEEIEGRRGVTNISSGGSDWEESSRKRLREKGPMDNFFTPNVEVVVENKRSEKMTQTTSNEA